MPIVPSSSPVASVFPSASKLSESTLLPVRSDGVVSFPVVRSRKVTLPSVWPKAASDPRGARAAGSPSRIVLTVLSVRASRSSDEPAAHDRLRRALGSPGSCVPENDQLDLRVLGARPHLARHDRPSVP
jgi:hypothetical protein